MTAQLNSVLLEGTLAQDPKLETRWDGTPVCTLAVQNNHKEYVSYVEAIATGKLATVCADYLKKGRGVRVVGRLKQEFTDGYAASRVWIVAEHVEFMPEARS